MNTRFLEAEYDYVKPETLDEALHFLDEHDHTKVFAGGTDLIVKMKMGAYADLKYMVDINAIDELKTVKKDKDGSLVIGGAVKLSHLEKDPVICEEYPDLVLALKHMASISIRNMGTIGGNFCNASPVADTALPAICHKACVEIKSAAGVRYVDAVDFFIKPGVSVVTEKELVTAVIFPPVPENTGADFIKFSRVASDIAKLSTAILITRDGDKIKECRIAMGAVAAKPIYLKEVCESLSGKTMTKELAEETADAIAESIRPITDTRSTAEYRKEATKVIIAEAMMNAWTRSGGKAL